ncbi:MAG: phage integrase N-terminal SAM-like domain-containing protein [Methylococcales bacterium]
MGAPKLKSVTPSVPLRSAPKRLDQLRDRIRVKHYSIRTEQAYVDWRRRFILFHGKRHPAELGKVEVEAFLTHLAVAGRVSASTQNQAKSAILFLYREVLEQELAWLDEVTKARESRRLPVVLTHAEVGAVLGRLKNLHGLLGRLLYGTGMRLMEAMRLRVKDVEFERREIIIRDGKGFKDRVTIGVLFDRFAEIPPHSSETTPRGRSGRGARQRLPALRAGTQIPQRGSGMGLAIGVSGHAVVGRSAFRRDAAPLPLDEKGLQRAMKQAV